MQPSGSWLYVWIDVETGEVAYVGGTGFDPELRAYLHVTSDDPRLGRVRATVPQFDARDFDTLASELPDEVDRQAAREALIAELEQYFREYLAPQGIYIEVPEKEWGSSTGKAFLARVAANNELAYGLHGARTLLDWQRANDSSIDLYVPEEPMFRNALEWMIRRGGDSLLTGMNNTRDSQAMRALWQLPTPSLQRYQELTIKDLLLVREEAALAAWRGALTSALNAFIVSKAIESDSKAVTSFTAELEARRQEAVAAVRSTKAFKDMTGSAGLFGLSAVVAARVSLQLGSDPWVGTIAGAAGTAAAATPNAIRVMGALATEGSRKQAVREGQVLLSGVSGHV